MGENVVVRSVDLSDSSNPIVLAVGIKSRPRASEQSKILGDQFIWTEAILLHVFLAVDIMLRQMFSAYDAMVTSTDAAADKIHPLNATQFAGTRFESLLPCHNSANLAHLRHRFLPVSLVCFL